MQIRLTVLGPRSGHSTRACDVLVTAPAGTALSAVASSLAAAVAGAGADVGGAGAGSGPVVLYAGQERLDLQRAALGEPPLIDGAVLSLQGPGPAPAHGLPAGPARLRVVSGPDAGGVHLLHGGQIRIGRSTDADVPLDDPDVSRMHCAVTVAPDGAVTVADLRSTNGTAVDGTELDDRPAPLPAGALLRIGESALRLQPSPATPDPALPATPDGEGHLRVHPAGGGAPSAEEHRPAPGGAAPAYGTQSTPSPYGGTASPYGGGAVPSYGARGAAPAGAPYGGGRYNHEAGPAADTAGAAGHPGPAARSGAAREDGVGSGRIDSGPGRAAGPGPGPTQGPYGAPGPHRAETVRPTAYGAGSRAADARGAGAAAAPYGAQPAAGPYAAGDRHDTYGGSPAAGPYAAGTPGAEAYAAGARSAEAYATDARAAVRPAADRYGAAVPHEQEPQRGQSYGAQHGRPYGAGAGSAHGHPADSGDAVSSPGSGAAPPGVAGSGRRGTPVRGTSAAALGFGAGQGGHGVAEEDDREGGAPGTAPDPRSAATHGGRRQLVDPYAQPGGEQPADAEPPADADASPSRRPTRRGGWGAWARRLAGGRGGAEAATDEEAAQQAAAYGTEAQSPAVDGPGALPEDGRGPAGYERWPDAATVLLTALGPGPRLWERDAGHPDALTVRLGTADRDGGRSAAPVTVALRSAGSLGLAGPRPRLAGLARAAVAQLATLHAPGTLEIVLLAADRARTTAQRLEEWSWLGWLPHVRPAHAQDCRLLLAYDREQAAARTAELVRRLDDGPLGPGWASAERSAVAAAAARHRGPYTLVIADGDPGTSGLRETVARLAAGGPSAGVHVLALAETPSASPVYPLAATYEAARAASPGLR
ncbi:FHA domain-containing protein [Streptomyces sclerotialus]|uniref:FHA domain-containing protein n=1 Tax=Streptomyces sclerotialus TaxID=1957 RepID=UPI003F5F86F4